jgi:hypothetical protein
MRRHSDALSRSSLQKVNHSKYNKVNQTQFPKDARLEYDIFPSGWRKKVRKEVKP